MRGPPHWIRLGNDPPRRFPDPCSEPPRRGRDHSAAPPGRVAEVRNRINPVRISVYRVPSRVTAPLNHINRASGSVYRVRNSINRVRSCVHSVWNRVDRARNSVIDDRNRIRHYPAMSCFERQRHERQDIRLWRWPRQDNTVDGFGIISP
uniref:Uncharacterized protein n=1 Tax=Candidatus Kentrum sp. TC TaxID=2126339 RepID=A0A450YF87_9GAMM|nr:MAG: hypothetical protein BECKTC1821D_GA0114238_10091 [Candidatus Kentron sp. TC]